jgi:hypothetical protein
MNDDLRTKRNNYNVHEHVISPPPPPNVRNNVKSIGMWGPKLSNLDCCVVGNVRSAKCGSRLWILLPTEDCAACVITVARRALKNRTR